MPHFTTTDNCRIYFEIENPEVSRPVVVFLNGTMQNNLYWKPQALAFRDTFRVLTYDARTQGQSEVGTKKLSREVHASDLLALMDHLGVEKAHLVGLSHGAGVAVACATIAPERVDRMVLCSAGAAASYRARLAVKSWLRLLEESGLEILSWAVLPLVFGEDFLSRNERLQAGMVKAMVSRNRKEALAAHFRAMMSYPPLSQTARDLHVPCLVLSGSDDPIVTKEGAERLAALLGGRHEYINGIGHSIPYEAPELFNKTLMEFLSGKA